MGMALLHYSPHLAKRLIGAAMISHERQVRYDKSMPCPAGYSPGVVNHVIHRNRYRRVIAQHHIAKRISDKNDIDPCLLRQTSRRIIIGGDHRDRDVILFHFFHFNDV
ncbi:hypothetical protein D3C77_484850 [compost metagenome]